MDAKQKEKRKRIMGRSIALGHCVCDPRKPCPCPALKDFDVCECAGEKLPTIEDSTEIKLTDYVRAAGCASKIGKKDLSEILSSIPEIDDPRVLVGSSAGDDAGVFLINSDSPNAMILTVDVFAPSVDDAYTFGQIAAANSVSDIYAMGGSPLAALSIIGFPIHELPNRVMAEILRGGVDKMKEANVPVIGGHSINDAEIKCGFAVLGNAPKNGFVRNQGAEVGDKIVLTKPLGVGIVAFASQVGRGSENSMSEIINSMTSLNKTAAELMMKHGASAATDVTGYSLLGHLSEIVKNSGVAVEIDFDAIPLFSGVIDFARSEILPGAVERNREAVPEKMLDFSDLEIAQENILFCPETSGGLLAFLPADNAENYVKELHANGIECAAVVGEVIENHSGGIIIPRTSRRADFTPLKIKQNEDIVMENEEKSCCCSETAPPNIGAETLSCCASPGEVDNTASTPEPSPAAGEAFQNYMAAVNQPGAISLKNKKLMALALSIVTKCEPCVKINTSAARDAGANDAEIAEAVALGIAFGGAPTAMFYNMIKRN